MAYLTICLFSSAYLGPRVFAGERQERNATAKLLMAHITAWQHSPAVKMDVLCTWK